MSSNPIISVQNNPSGYPMFTKEEIRSKREKVRLEMQNSFKQAKVGQFRSLDQNCENHRYNSDSSTDLVTLRKQKHSDNFRLCNNMNSFKEIHSIQSFEGSFILLEKLGQGAQSVVYKCESRETGELFAVKKIRNSEVELTTILKEQYRILKNLNHDSIIKANYIFVNAQEGTSHMVSELCDYPSLREEITKKQSFRQAEAGKVLYQIAKALVYLHEKGVAHRDLKPQNIMFDQVTEEIKLIDFQISKMKKYEHEKLTMWTNTGTLQYKAPEMFSGSYDQKIDIWAFGVIAYELITGHLPFESTYHSDTIKMITEKDPLYCSLSFTSLCEDFVKKCLSKDPQKRLTAQQILRSPFILKHARDSQSRGSLKLKKAETYSYDAHVENDHIVEDEGFYDENSRFSGCENIDKDLGIRVVEAE